MAVYFIQDEGGAIKIGYSEGNPHRRLNHFRTGNPRELSLLVSIPGGAAEEKALHERFAKLRIRGEWFQPDARLLGFIEAMRYKHVDVQPQPVADGAAHTLAGLSWSDVLALRAAIKAADALDGLAFCADDIAREQDRGARVYEQGMPSLRRLSEALNNDFCPDSDGAPQVVMSEQMQDGVRFAFENWWDDASGSGSAAPSVIRQAQELRDELVDELSALRAGQ